MSASDVVAAITAAWKALLTGESVIMPNAGGIDMPTPDASVVGRARQTQTVITGLVIVITASLAVIVVDQFDQSLGDPSSSNLSTAQNDVLQGFSDMTSLIGPLLLVLIAVVIVGVVQRLR